MFRCICRHALSRVRDGSRSAYTRVSARVSLRVRAKSHVARTGDARKRRLGDVFQSGVARGRRA